MTAPVKRPRKSTLGLAGGLVTGLLAAVRLISALVRGDPVTDAVIEAGVLGIVGVALLLWGRSNRGESEA